ncbi:hypothetical protein [Laspinema olomoucense]|uniref:hypothetical protein n=1 Tax=Laspinema olomoucense TaxID=3231600 RepID=UPI0021BAFE0A|nr:hypothetical protein [Laspinema sp. D3c]MCT7992527.1 hypothetical protein [Laspinema sp. D3c]
MDSNTFTSAIEFLQNQKQQGKIPDFIVLSQPFMKLVHLGIWMASTEHEALIVKAYRPLINQQTGQITRHFDLFQMPIHLAKQTVLNQLISTK